MISASCWGLPVCRAGTGLAVDFHMPRESMTKTALTAGVAERLARFQLYKYAY
jgi:hypothetical protein